MVFVELAEIALVAAIGGVFWSLLGFGRNALLGGSKIDWNAVGKNVFVGALIGTFAGIYGIGTGQTFDLNTLSGVGIIFLAGFNGSVVVDKLIIPIANKNKGTTTPATSPAAPAA